MTFFVFKFPSGSPYFRPFKRKHRNPYLWISKTEEDAIKDYYDGRYDGRVDIAQLSKDDLVQDTLEPFCLPRSFKVELIYGDEKIPENDFRADEWGEPDYYEFTFLTEMSRMEVEIAFSYRAMEYFKKGKLNDFLDFHYSKYFWHLDDWLNLVTQMIAISYRYIAKNMPQLSFLKMKKQANDWIAERWEELAELEGKTPIEEPQNVREAARAVEKVEERVKLKWDTDKAVLYDLFAQLSLVNGHNNKSIIGNTIENLAVFLSENVEGFPAPKTIETQIYHFRNSDKPKPKKNAISLSINKS